MVHHVKMTTKARIADDRVERQRRLLVRCGVFVAFVGLALYQLDDDRLTDLLGSALVFTGALMTFPQLVVQALKDSRP